MGRLIFIFYIFTNLLFSDFEASCVKCHTKENVDLRQTYMSALLVYGGEKSFKTALFYYCKNPASMTSVMDEWFLAEHKTPNPIKLSDSELKKMLDRYWKRYEVTKKLK